MTGKKPLLTLTLALAISGNANATMLGVVQTYPDITLNQNYLIYDNNAIDNTTGLLKLISFGSTLNEGPDSGNSTLTQSYSGPGDSAPNLMFTIAIDRTNGNWVSSENPVANKVSIGFGNSVILNDPSNTPGFSWQGDINAFGWNTNGTFFDATWTMSSDNYVDMPASLAQFTDGVLTDAMAAYMGGIKISNSAGFGASDVPAAYQTDWVFGANANSLGIQALLAPFLTELSASACNPSTQTGCTNYIHSTVTSDLFVPVPVPAALWLWAGALALVAPFVKQIKGSTLARENMT